jgi:hypothetical protein
MAKHKDIPLTEWLNTQQAADAMGITARHVARMCERGELDCKKLAPRLWLVNPRAVAEWKPQRRRKLREPSN